MEEAIKRAIEGGWKPKRVVLDQITMRHEEILLDPLFWQALGKAEGWKQEGVISSAKMAKKPDWVYQWIKFIEHLAEGKDADSFFKELLK